MDIYGYNIGLDTTSARLYVVNQLNNSSVISIQEMNCTCKNYLDQS